MHNLTESERQTVGVIRDPFMFLPFHAWTDKQQNDFPDLPRSRAAFIAQQTEFFREFTEHCIVLGDKGEELPLEWSAARQLFAEAAFGMLYDKGWIALLLLKARQGYMSTTSQAFLLYRMCHIKGIKALTISHSKPSAGHIAGDMSIYMAERLPRPWMQQAIDMTAKKPKLQTNWKGVESQDTINMIFANGSTLRTQSARTVKNPRSFTFPLVHMSEVAFFFEDMNGREAADKMITALMPTIGFGKNPWATCFAESTANGPQGVFYEMCQKARTDKGRKPEDSQSQFRLLFLPFYVFPQNTVPVESWMEGAFKEYRRLMDVGAVEEAESHATTLQLTPFEREICEVADDRLTFSHILWERRVGLPSLQGDTSRFKQEYPSCVDEAFLSTGSMAFSPKVVADYREHAMDPVWHGTITLDDHRKVVMAPVGRDFRVYKRWVEGHEYIIGADCAAGSAAGDTNGVQDSSAAAVLDRMTGEVVAVYHSAAPTPGEFANILYAIGSEYHFPVLAIDRDGPGFAVLEVLKLLKYPRLYMRPMFDHKLGADRMVVGYALVRIERDAAVYRLRDGIQSRRCKVYDVDMLDQLGAMIMSKAAVTTMRRERMHFHMGRESEHDDLIFCLVLAWGAHKDRDLVSTGDVAPVKPPPDPRGQPVLRGDGSILFWKPIGNTRRTSVLD